MHCLSVAVCPGQGLLTVSPFLALAQQPTHYCSASQQLILLHTQKKSIIAAPLFHGSRVQNTAADWIEANLEGGPVVSEKFVGGSNWSSAYVYTTQQGKEYFVKLAMGGRDDSMFQGEAQGLQAMYGKHKQC